MNTTSTIYKNLPEKRVILPLVDKGDFKSVINLLLKAGVPENDLGELLFSFGNDAFAENKFTTAIAIFIFLTDALEDKSEAFPLFKKIGDLYTLISDHGKAREYYGRLPLTLENIKLCFQTFIPTLDIDGLLSLRDIVLSRVPETNHGQIHTFMDDVMMAVAAIPEIFESHLRTCKLNIAALGKIPPFTSDATALQQDITSTSALYWTPNILKISDTTYLKQDKVWKRMIPNDHQNNLNKKKLISGTNIMVHCNSFESLFDFISLVQTDNPEFIKYECRVIIDFNLLKLILSVFDLSPLNNCNFIIRFINKNNLKSHLIHLLLERKLPFTNRVVYLSQDDYAFFSKHVISTLKECERKMLQNVEQYEQQLLNMFPDTHQNTVIQKIKTGQNLKILFFTSRFTTYMQHSTRDIAEGFRQLGHNTFIESEEEDSGVSIRKDVCLENLINFQPDIIFSINHFRFSYPWVPASIPFVTWIQDLMPHIRNLNDFKQLEGNNNHIFTFSNSFKDYLDQHPIYKRMNINVLPIPINQKIFFPLPEHPKKYDVIYVTHLNADLDKNTLKPFREGKTVSNIDSTADSLFLKKIALELGKMSLTELWNVYRCPKSKKALAVQICNRYSLTFKDSLLTYLNNFDQNGETLFGKDIVSLMKIKPIELLIENGVAIKIVGRNWKKIKNFENIAMGSIENGPLLNEILNESKIILNISPGNSYHMRAADAIAANCFVLNFLGEGDGMPITDLFEPEKEVITFNSDKELIKKIKYYLNNKKERDRIAYNAYIKAKSKYSCDMSAAQIIMTIGQDAH